MKIKWAMSTNELLRFMYLIRIVMIFVGNLIFVNVLVKANRLHHSPQYLIASVALADLLMATEPIPLVNILAYYGR